MGAYDLEKIKARLQEALRRRLPGPGDYQTPAAGFSLHRRDIANKPENCFNKPVAAVTVQGAKRTVVGSEEYRYGAGYCLVAGVDLPSMSYLTEASPKKPYLVMTLNLDSHLTAQLAAQMPPAQAAAKSGPGFGVAEAGPELLEAFWRLLELLGQPEHIALLAPLIVREIHFRLLLGPLGGLLKNLNTRGTPSNQILRGINWLLGSFKEPLDVEALAGRVNMAPSTFRRHFKAVTSMSPTRYHQHLRLYEAQRLMLENNASAAGAGAAVGYESLAQFNREYKRLFGAPPARSVSRLR